MNMDSKNNFLIKKTSGEIYQTKEYKKDSVMIERLGDLTHKEIKLSRLEQSYYVIDKDVDSVLWKNIFTFLKNEIEQYEPFQYVYVYSDEQEKITPVHLKDLNDPIYAQLEQAIENLAIKNFKEVRNNEKNKKLTTLKRKATKRKSSATSGNIAKDLNPEEGEEESFIIINPDPVIDNLESIIMHPQTRETIEQVLVQFELGDFFQTEWSTNRVNKDKKSALNFYGPPGTGKTITAKSIANHFNKSILQVDYSMLMSKYMGETGKNIKKYFDKAKSDDLILFLDEADALLQRRTSDTSSSSASYNNQNQINFMQELDRFDGIIILTTNHFANYDEAQFRRFRHVEFLLPTTEMREIIIKDHIPPKVNLENGLDFKELSKMTDSFSGGDIKNLVENVLKNFAMKVRKEHKEKDVDRVKDILRTSVISKEFFVSEINKIKEAKKHYNKEGKIKMGKIGLVPSQD